MPNQLPQGFPCPFHGCDAIFTTVGNRKRHLTTIHNRLEPVHDCSLCGRVYRTLQKLKDHRRKHAVISKFKMVNSTLDGVSKRYRRLFQNVFDLESAFRRSRRSIVSLLRTRANRHNCIKVCFVFVVTLYREEDGHTKEHALRFPATEIYPYTDVGVVLEEVHDRLALLLDEVHEGGSGYRLECVDYVDLEVSRVYPLNGACGHLGITDLNELRKLTPPTSVDGNDCFFRCLAAAYLKKPKYHSDHRYLIGYYKKKFKINIPCPVSVSDIRKFETDNRELGLAINVLYSSASSDAKNCKLNVFPLYRSSVKDEDKRKVVNLLLYKTVVNGQVVGHYLLIKDISQLLKRRYQKSSSQTLHCNSCLHVFWKSKNVTMEQLKQEVKEHKFYCYQNKIQATVYPEKGQTLKFKNYHNCFFNPITIIFDFEGFQDTSESACPKCKDMSKCKHRTKILYEQKPLSFSMFAIDEHLDIVKQKTYAGEDCAKVLLDTLEDWEEDLMERLQTFKDRPILTDAEEQDFQSATECWMCQEPFEPNSKDYKTRDHSHYDGRYLAALHNSCNKARRTKYRIPCLSHNFAGYDSHFLISHIDSKSKLVKKRLTALPKSTEKFRCVTLGSYRFLDSMAFLSGSLDSLVASLRASNHTFPLLDKIPEFAPAHKKELLIRKGVFCYEYCSSIEKMEATTELPPKEEFFSRLTNSDVSDEDYAHAQEVWRVFDCDNLKTYCNLYCRLDVLLLAECIMKFRKQYFAEFQLDPLNYVSLPGVSFDSFLRSSKVELDLLSDPLMYQIFDASIRGGVSYISGRYCAAKKVPDKDGKVTSMFYIDGNNLYGYSMSLPLPMKDFRWENPSLFPIHNIKQQLAAMTDSQERGYTFVVDLVFPDDVHDKLSSFPPAPNHRDIVYDDLSPYSQDCLKQFRGDSTAKSYKAKKLCADFEPKRRYAVSYMNLKTYLNLGLEVTKVHNVISYVQKPFLKGYIDLCTQKRMQAKTDFDKNVMKLTANSIFGKFCEDVRSHQKVHLCTTRQKAMKHMSTPFFNCFREINKNLLAVFVSKKRVKLHKPVQVGFEILESSKRFMVEQFYENMKPKFESLEVLMTDTDSFVCQARVPPGVNPLDKISSVMDYSNYPEDHPKHDDSRKNIPGFFKDELKSDRLEKWAGIRSKAYSMQVSSSQSSGQKYTNAALKGVRKGFKKKIPFEVFVNVLKTKSQYYVNQFNISAKNHRIFLVENRKVGLSSFADKRMLLNCGIHSYPRGHYRLRSDDPFHCDTCQRNDPFQ